MVIGHSWVDAPPALTPLRNLTGASDQDDRVVAVRMRTHSVDLHGLAALHRWRRHELVQADNYLYLHDTCTFEPQVFLARLAWLHLPRSSMIVTSWPLPASNVALLGADVVRRIGRNFDTPLTKREGFSLEYGFNLRRTDGSEVRPLVSFGGVVRVAKRRANGSADLYGTGHPRDSWYYPAFGVYKHVMPGATGDLTGQWALTEGLGRRGRRPWPKNATVADVRFSSQPECWYLTCRRSDGAWQKQLLLYAATPPTCAQLLSWTRAEREAAADPGTYGAG